MDGRPTSNEPSTSDPGSNSIEGYTVTEQDAAAAVEDEPPLSTDDRTWAEIRAYRRVLTYVLHVGAEPGFEIDESSIRSMHFMHTGATGKMCA